MSTTTPTASTPPAQHQEIDIKDDPKPALAIICDPESPLYAELRHYIILTDVFSGLHEGKTSEDFVPFLAALEPGQEVIVFTFPMPGAHEPLKHLVASARVKWIHCASAGLNRYDFPAMAPLLRQHDVRITHTTANRIPLREHVLMNCLYFNRHLPTLMANKKAHKYERLSNRGMVGQKMGIVGYGSIGSTVGEAAAALGMQVTGHRRRPVEKGEVGEGGAKLVSGEEGLAKLLAESNFVVDVLPSTEATRHFFTQKHFAQMRKDAVFINIGRGDTVCEADLVAALKEGQIAGAGLDVFEKEPLPEDSPLWDIPDDKFLSSPHNSCYVDSAVAELADEFSTLAHKYVLHGELGARTAYADLGY